MSYFLYILQSQKTQKYYIGQTNNLERRLKQHNNGQSKSTKNGKPWELIYTEEFEKRSEAMSREAKIKSLKSRIYIERLISQIGERPD